MAPQHYQPPPLPEREEVVLVATLQMNLIGLKRGFSHTTGGYALLCNSYASGIEGSDDLIKITQNRYMRLRGLVAEKKG